MAQPIRYDPIFRILPLYWFHGKIVQTTLRILPRGRERAWVSITGHRDGKLVGTLINQPTFSNLNQGDEVEVPRTKIIGVE